MELRALAEAMTGAIHFVPWSRPTALVNSGFFMPQVSHRPGVFGYRVDIQTVAQPFRAAI